MEEILLILVVQNLVDSFSGCREKCFSIFIYMKHLKLWRFETILLFFMKREGEKVRNTSKSCIISRCELLMVGTTDFQLTQFYTIITSQSPKQSSSKKDSWSPECVGSQNLKITCSENAWNFNFAKISCSEFWVFYSTQLLVLGLYITQHTHNSTQLLVLGLYITQHTHNSTQLLVLGLYHRQPSCPHQGLPFHFLLLGKSSKEGHWRDILVFIFTWAVCLWICPSFVGCVCMRAKTFIKVWIHKSSN